MKNVQDHSFMCKS